jgi:hypothetical protein
MKAALVIMCSKDIRIFVSGGGQKESFARIDPLSLSSLFGTLHRDHFNSSPTT